MRPVWEVRRPKSEVRSPKEIRIPKSETRSLETGFGFLFAYDSPGLTGLIMTCTANI
jgi:hypothetical protein